MAQELETRTAEFAVIVPTFNEADNVEELIQRLESCLEGENWEVVFVDDDSRDGTVDRLRQIARHKRHVRCLHRIGRRGLASACAEGVMSTSAPYIAVMDADGQHDETILPKMLEVLRSGDADLVIGSRYMSGGSIGTWDASRARISRLASQLSRAVIKQDLTDPMSGFFAIRREAFESSVRKLSNIGFKVLVDVIASSPQPLRVKETPYEFRNRRAGESKLDSQAVWDYLMLLADKLIGHLVPVRFVAFSLVGAMGVFVHFGVLATLYRLVHLPFAVGQAAATLAAITGNFTLNNLLTFRDLRLKGWAWVKGWMFFMLVCSLGALANVGIASYLFTRETAWPLAAVCGIVVGSIWNYAVAAKYTWAGKKR